MGKKRHSAEQIISVLRQVEIEIAKGTKADEAIRQAGITAQTYYRWREEYGGLKVDQAKRFKELEKENARLKHIVADLTLDIRVLKEVKDNLGNF